MTDRCPQCGYPDMSVSHDATCLECGVPVHAATPDPADHLCPTHRETQMLVDVALEDALDQYDRAMMHMPWDGKGGDPDEARMHLTKALKLMERRSDAVKAHPTYAYWHGEIVEQLAKSPPEGEGEQ